MIGADWKDVGNLVVKLVTREPPFVQILYVLSAAFAVVMFVEGVRVNFLPARKHSASPRVESPRIDAQIAETSATPLAGSAIMAAELPNQDRPRILRSLKANNSSGTVNSRQAARPKSRGV